MFGFFFFFFCPMCVCIETWGGGDYGYKLHWPQGVRVRGGRELEMI